MELDILLVTKIRNPKKEPGSILATRNSQLDFRGQETEVRWRMPDYRYQNSDWTDSSSHNLVLNKLNEFQLLIRRLALFYLF